MKRQPIHPADYDTEFNLLIRGGLSPRQAASCLKYLRRDKRAALRLSGKPPEYSQLTLKPPPGRFA